MEYNELEEQIKTCEKLIRDRLDDYYDTVYAILGFCSLWFFDTATQENRPSEVMGSPAVRSQGLLNTTKTASYGRRNL